GDTKYKSPEEVEEMLVRAAGNNSNLLLNIGPMPNGEIAEEFQTRLRTVGSWLAKYGDSIYGTRGGPVPPADWGVTTPKANKIYIPVLKGNAHLLPFPVLEKKIPSAQERGWKKKIAFLQTAGGVFLQLPPATKNEVDRVIVLSVN